MFIHFGGVGNAIALARGVHDVQDAIVRVRTAYPLKATPVESGSDLDVAKLDALLGLHGERDGGVYRVAIPRPDVRVTELGVDLGATMSPTSWAAFEGTAERAAVAGELMVTTVETQPVIHTLREAAHRRRRHSRQLEPRGSAPGLRELLGRRPERRARRRRPQSARSAAARRVTDRRLLFATAFVRALSVGMIGVLLGLHLAALPLDAAHIGIVVAAGLAGGAVASLLVTLGGDRLGRRRTLVLLAVATAAGGIALAFFHDFVTLTIAAFLGMANGMGRDRGAALVIEQAILPATVEDSTRTQTFAWYNVLQDAGHALGSLAAGLPVVLQTAADLAPTAALRLSVCVYAALALVGAGFYLRLSPTVERARARASACRPPRAPS